MLHDELSLSNMIENGSENGIPVRTLVRREGPDRFRTIGFSVLMIFLLASYFFLQVDPLQRNTIKGRARSNTSSQPYLSVSTQGNHSVLYRQNLSLCLPYPFTLDPTSLQEHATFRDRLQCYCVEQHPKPFDNRNCFIRIRNATIHHRIDGMPKGGEIASVIYMSDTPFSFRMRIDNSRFALSQFKIVLKGLGPCSGDETKESESNSIPDSDDSDQKRMPWQPRCPVQATNAFSHPYTQPFDFSNSPILYIPTLAIHVNFYHSQFGPTGVLQIQAARELINNFYETQNSAHSKDKVPLVPSPNATFNGIRYRFGPSSPRVYPANRGSCNGMNFSSETTYDSSSKQGSFSKSSDRFGLPPTFLAREMLYGDTFMGQPSADVENPMDWFGRRMGFCLQELPRNSLASVSDLWVNIPLLQLGSQRLVRRAPAIIEAQTAPIVLADEFYTVCPLNPEEMTIARNVIQQMRGQLDQHPPSMLIKREDKDQSNARHGHFTTASCLPVTRQITQRQTEQLCVLVVGRPLSTGANGIGFGVRGLPEGIEHFILNALLYPISNPQAKEMPNVSYVSQWWNGSSRCDLATAEELVTMVKRELQRPIDEAFEVIESLNYEAGLPPCIAISFESPNMYIGLNFSFRQGNNDKGTKSYFPPDKYYPWAELVRTTFDRLPLAHQYAHIKAANLFIFEEGAPLAWAMYAPKGSTFIIVYSSPFMRMAGSGTSRSKRKKDKSKRSITGGVMSSIEFFTFFPHLSGQVRLIFLVHQYGRFPSFGRLRQVYDLPWRPETYVITCECNHTRVAPWDATHHPC